MILTFNYTFNQHLFPKANFFYLFLTKLSFNIKRISLKPIKNPALATLLPKIQAHSFLQFPNQYPIHLLRITFIIPNSFLIYLIFCQFLIFEQCFRKISIYKLFKILDLLTIVEDIIEVYGGLLPVLWRLLDVFYSWCYG